MRIKNTIFKDFKSLGIRQDFIKNIFLAGSIADDINDEFSDIDIWVIINDFEFGRNKILEWINTYYPIKHKHYLEHSYSFMGGEVYWLFLENLKFPIYLDLHIANYHNYTNYPQIRRMILKQNIKMIYGSIDSIKQSFISPISSKEVFQDKIDNLVEELFFQVIRLHKYSKRNLNLMIIQTKLRLIEIVVTFIKIKSQSRINSELKPSNPYEANYFNLIDHIEFNSDSTIFIFNIYSLCIRLFDEFHWETHKVKSQFSLIKKNINVHT